MASSAATETVRAYSGGVIPAGTYTSTAENTIVVQDSAGRATWVDARSPHEVLVVAAAVQLFDDFTSFEQPEEFDELINENRLYPRVLQPFAQTKRWVVNGADGVAVELLREANGILRLCTTATDDECIHFASADCNWSSSRGACMEVRARANDTSGTCWFVGVTNRSQFGAGTIPAYCNAALMGVDTAYTNIANGAGFIFDPDAATEIIRCVSVKDYVQATTINGTATADAKWHTYRIDCAPTGTLTYYLDGALLGTSPLGLGTGVDAIGNLYIGVQNREAAVNTFDIDYIKAWQDR